jgi:hypothetical protein
MKKIFASASVALLTVPLSTFACDGGTAGFDLPAPPPTALETVASSVTNNVGLFIGLALGTVIGAFVARRRKLVVAKTPAAVANPAA